MRSPTVRAATAAALAAILIAGCRASPEPAPTGPTAAVTADLVILGGPILTMDPKAPRADVVAVRGGEIVAVGTRAQVGNVRPGAKVLDLRGATLMPGFVDAHSHFFVNPGAAGTDRAGISEYILSLGITTTTEMWVDEGLLAELEQLTAANQIGVRLNVYLAGNTSCGEPIDHWWTGHPPTHTRGEMLRIAGVKIFSDGGACNTPAVSYEYANGEGNGDLYFTVDQLADLVAEVDAAGHQVAIHALGDRAIQTTLDALERVIADTGNPRRHRIEHSAALRPDLRARHGEVGAVVDIFGAFQTCFFLGANAGRDFKFRTPPQYLSWEWPWRSLLQASPDAHFAWHADFPVFPSADPVSSLFGFVTRAQVAADGPVCEPTPAMAAEAIDVERALEIMTTGSAYALFRDNEIGRIAPGMLADFAVLSGDPTAVPPAELKDLEVWMTMVGGRVGWCAEGHQELCP